MRRSDRNVGKSFSCISCCTQPKLSATKGNLLLNKHVKQGKQLHQLISNIIYTHTIYRTETHGEKEFKGNQTTLWQ